MSDDGSAVTAFREFASQGDVAFGDLMDALAPEPDAEAGGAGTPAPAGTGATGGVAGSPAPPAPAGTGQPGAGVEGTPAPAAAGSADAGGSSDGAAADKAGGGQGGAEGTPGGSAPEPPAGSQPVAATGIDPAPVVVQLGELSTTFEKNLGEAYTNAAYKQIVEEHPKYIEALKTHPRLLVGKQVPAIGKEGMETLRTSDDAREWQEAVKSVLSQEIEARRDEQFDEARDFIATVHAAIDMFKQNPDLIPGTKGFNLQLATEFTRLAQPYELRVDGKLQGYSVPVQPLIDGLRASLKERQPPPPPAPAQQTPAQKPADPPQAAITNKSGQASGGAEDFSALFGTLGMPEFRI